MKQLLQLGLLAALVVGLVIAVQRAQTVPQPLTITLIKQSPEQWWVDYRSPQPVSQLVFIRNPDQSRQQRWQPLDSAFEVSQTEANEERIRRRDGAQFEQVRLQLTPTYVSLEKDYAPFSPFTDGGMAWFTGRFKVCPEHCDNSAALQYQFVMQALASDAIRIPAQQFSASGSWLEAADDGQVVYVGPQQQTDPFLDSVIDPGLPYALQTSLRYDLPPMLQYFAERLQPLTAAPMLLASFSATEDGRYGQQGGVIGRQLFVHWYGHSMHERMTEANFINDTLWFFAHEVGHLYQSGIYSNQDAWIHEGVAEFMAYDYLHHSGGREGYLQQRFAQAEQQCFAVNQGGSAFAKHYSCGLLVAVTMHERLLRDHERGLYRLWQDYKAVYEGGSEANATTYLQLYESLTDSASAAAVLQYLQPLR